MRDVLGRWILGLTIATVACAGPEGPTAAPSIDGVWVLEGYGMVIEVEGTSMRGLDVTGISCAPSFTVSRRSTTRPGAIAEFGPEEGPGVMLVLPDDRPDRIRLQPLGTASHRVARRTDALPVECAQPSADTPENNFEVFARTWSEQYGFFDLKGLDWDAVVASNRPKVHSGTTPEELFDVLAAMIEPLEDAYSGILAPDLDRTYRGFRNGPNRLTDAQQARALEIVETNYLEGPIRNFCNEQVQFGMFAGSIGYLRITSFGGYGTDNTFQSGLTALEEALDTIFADSGSLRGLIIDVRLNTGGADPYGLEIVSRLAEAEYEAYAKQARLDPEDASLWTDLQPSVITPSQRPGFRGPVVELIGLHTISAGETFTQALLGRTPVVVRVGESTQGVFSDTLGRELPIGWRFWLANERFVTDGKTYDGPGIPPHFEVPVFSESDLAAGTDGAIERALELLEGMR